MMSDKELLSRLKELLMERKNMLEQEENDKSNTESKTIGGFQKKLGTHPQTGKISMTSENDNNHQKGYSSIFMLGFLTFFFETLFLLISYFIFK